MKKILSILNCGLFGRNGALLCAIIAFVLTGLFAASCAKSEIAQDESIANAAQSGAAAEGQDDPAGDDQGNPDDPNPGDPSDPSVPVGPVQPGDDYISPDHFNMVQLTFGACADAEDNPSQPAQAGAFGTKGLFTPEEAASREESLDDEPTKTYLSDVTEAGGQKKQYIYWNQGDKLKIYYTEGKQNFSDAIIKHGDRAESTIDGWVNKNDDYYYAFYPNRAPGDYPIESSVSYEGNGSFTVTVPAVQNGDFGHCHMAVGKATKADKQFAFTNVGSYMKLTVANTDATAITIQASNTSDKIVGTFTVPFAAEGLGINEGGITYGECSCSLRVNLPKPRAANLDVYVALLPKVNFSDGFRIRYEYDEDGDGVDDDPHPGFAYVKRTGGGARDERSVERKKILNFSTVSFPTLDARIVENYFVTTSGSCSDADVAGAGNSWGNALNATGLADLLSQPVDGSGSQINDDAFDKAWRLDGATIHMAGGSYTLSDVRMACTDYDHPFKVSIKGGYPNIASGTSTSATRDTTTNKTTFAGSGSARILTLGNQTFLRMDKVWMTGGRSAANSDCGVALRLNPGSGSADAYLTTCGFKDNCCNHTDANGGAVALGSNNAWARFDGCHFYSNGTGAEQSAGAIYVWSADCLAELHLNGCTFVNNWSGYWGGAVGCSAGKVYINQEDNTVPTTFTTNYLTRISGSWGGALCVGGPDNGSSKLTAQNCDFIGNYVPSGAYYAFGGAISINGSANASFSNIRCKKHDTITRPMARNGAYLNIETKNGYFVTFEDSTFSDGEASNVGGCIQTRESCTANFSECQFISNHSSYAGGVCHINSTAHTVTFTECVFESNYNTGGGGGGVLSMENGTATFTSCTFTANQQRSTSGAGGGVFWLGKASNTTSTNLTVKGCTFTATSGGNKALTQTAGNSSTNQANGGGILYATFGNVTFTSSDGTASGTRTTISGSSSASAGGAFLMDKGSNDLTINMSYTDISGCSVASGNYGGAIYTDAPISLTSCTLNNNTGAYSGGAILMKGSAATLTMTDTDIQNNTSTNYGGGVYVASGLPYGSGTAVSVTRGTFSGNSAGIYGGAFQFDESGSSTSVLANFNSVTFSGNTAVQKGGVFHLNTTASNRVVTCTDCDFTENRQTSTSNNYGGGAVNLEGGTLTLNGCIFTGNVSLSPPSNPWGGGGAIYTGGVSELHLNISSSATRSSQFSQNSAASYGGAISHTNSSASSAISIANTVFSENRSAYSGGALYHKHTAALLMDKVGFDNNEVAGSSSSLNAEHAGDAICYLGSSLTMTGSTTTNYIKNHTSTVPIYSPNVTAYTFTGHTFEDNATTLRNGCMINLSGNSSFAISNSSITGNSAPNGGVIYADLAQGFETESTISGSTLSGNTATDAASLGGAIYWNCASWNNDNNNQRLRIYGNSVLTDNQASQGGSAIYLNVGRVYLVNSSVTNNKFANYDTSTDGYGGTIYMNSPYSKIDVEGCDISGNLSDGKGGAFYLNGGRLFLKRSTVNNNRAYSRGGAIYQTGADGFILVSQCSLVGNYLTKSSDWHGNCYHCNGGTNTYGMFLNSTIADGDTGRSTGTINGKPNLLMCNCTVIGNTSLATLRVEGGKNGILLNNIILNNGSGDAIYHSGDYTWSNIGGYNILGSINTKAGATVTNIPTNGSRNDKTGKVAANFGSWAWNAASGYYSWDGTLDEAAATSTPIVVSTDYISVGLKTGFNYSVTFNDSKDMNVTASNLGNRIVATWCGSNYYYDQRATAGLGDRRLSGCNFPGAFASSAAVNIGGGGQYSGDDINQNDYVY